MATELFSPGQYATVSGTYVEVDLEGKEVKGTEKFVEVDNRFPPTGAKGFKWKLIKDDKKKGK